jgi:hypothetical protein
MVKNIKEQPVFQDNLRLHGSVHRLFISFICSLFIGLPAALAEPLPGHLKETGSPAKATEAIDATEATDAIAQALLRKADQIRFPTEGFQVEISILSTKADQSTEARRYQVLSKGNDKTVVIVTEPASERGTNHADEWPGSLGIPAFCLATRALIPGAAPDRTGRQW